MGLSQRTIFILPPPPINFVHDLCFSIYQQFFLTISGSVQDNFWTERWGQERLGGRALQPGQILHLSFQQILVNSQGQVRLIHFLGRALRLGKALGLGFRAGRCGHMTNFIHVLNMRCVQKIERRGSIGIYRKNNLLRIKTRQFTSLQLLDPSYQFCTQTLCIKLIFQVMWPQRPAPQPVLASALGPELN